MNAAEAEKLFNTELYHHDHKDAPSNMPTSVIRATKPYHVPTSIADEVSIVENLIRFPRLEFVPTAIPERYAPPAFAGLEADDEFSSCGSKCTCPNLSFNLLYHTMCLSSTVALVNIILSTFNNNKKQHYLII
jgi:hypothetical protein